ncbi:MAG: hypothetical protein BWY79_00777 [Actinobacteria bacterium ADurb.Bin444]|nr:MAG: hypothetical protein BWY79_00777 [Actinobacteria bacterium ADurb.Bin444]
MIGPEQNGDEGIGGDGIELTPSLAFQLGDSFPWSLLGVIGAIGDHGRV